jgi:hypothetical protein
MYEVSLDEILKELVCRTTEIKCILRSLISYELTIIIIYKYYLKNENIKNSEHL